MLEQLKRLILFLEAFGVRENLFCHMFGEYIRINMYPFFVAVSAFLLSSLLGGCFIFFSFRGGKIRGITHKAML